MKTLIDSLRRRLAGFCFRLGQWVNPEPRRITYAELQDISQVGLHGVSFGFKAVYADDDVFPDHHARDATGPPSAGPTGATP